MVVLDGVSGDQITGNPDRRRGEARERGELLIRGAAVMARPARPAALGLS
jgi:hypothetical protein